MTGSTTHYGLVYPTASDPVYQGAAQMQTLAEDIDDLMYSNGVVIGGKVSKTGDTMTGNLAIRRDSNDVNLEIDSDPGKYSAVTLESNAVFRWVIRKNDTAESGSNAGSNFEIMRFSDAGGFLDIPFSINRATGNATLANHLTVTKNTYRSTQAVSADTTLDGTKFLTVLTGTTGRTFTLPAVSGNTGMELLFKNRATAAVNMTIQRAGADNLWLLAGTTTATSTTVAQGNSARFINDGTYWVQV